MQINSITENAEPSSLSQPAKNALKINKNKLQAALCIGASAAVSIACIVYLLRLFF